MVTNVVPSECVPRHAWPYLLPCVLVWALIPDLALQASNNGMRPAAFLFWSNLVSAMTLTIVAVAKGRGATLRQTPPGLAVSLMLLGCVGAFAYYALLYAAYLDAGSKPAALLAIQYTWPVLSACLAVVLGTERPTVVVRTGLALAVLAVVVALWNRQQAPPSGACLRVAAAALLFALYTVGSKRLAYDPYSGVAIMFMGATLASVPGALRSADMVAINPGVLPWIVVNGVVVNGVSYAWWQAAIVRAELATVAPWVSLTPLLAVTYMKLLGKAVEPLHWLGVGLCLTAVLMVETHRHTRGG